MTIEELKAQLAELQSKQADAAELKSQLEQKEQEINNLDASVKAQQVEIEALKSQVKSNKKISLKQAIAAKLEEKRDDIDKFVKNAADKESMTLELKLDSNITDGAVFVSAAEQGVSSVPHQVNAFLDNLPTDTVNGTSVAWLEGEYTSNADYVEELAESGNDTATVAEKRRSFGKIASHIIISSEVSDFLGQVQSWATNEAVALIDAKADGEILAGAGADVSAPRKVYGLKGQVTAFSALGKYTRPTVADVILDAVLQIRKAGFIANVAFVSFDALPAIRGAKDANGNYLYNQQTGVLGQVTIVPSAKLTAAQILVADSTRLRIKKRPTIEIELKRNAAKDGYDVYVRRAIQALVKKGDKGAGIWVNDSTAAITSITKE